MTRRVPLLGSVIVTLLACCPVAAAPAPVEIAANAAGERAIVFQPFGHPTRPLYALSAAPGADLSPLARLSTVPAREPFGTEGATLELNARGDAVVVWLEVNGDERRILLSIRPAAGGFAPAVEIGSGVASPGELGVSAPTVAIDGNGRFLAAWLSTQPDGQGDTRDALFGASGTVAEGVKATGELVARAAAFDVALSANGEGFLAWTDGSGPGEVTIARAGASGGFGAPLTISTQFDPFPVRVAANSTGQAAVAFEDADAVKVSHRPAGGSFQPPVDAGAIPEGEGGLDELELGDGGEAIVGWTGVGTHHAAILAGGAPTEAVSFPGDVATRVAIDGAGNAAAAGGNSGFDVRAAHRPAGAGFGGPVVVRRARHHLDPLEPGVAIAQGGDALIAYEISNGRRQTVLLSTLGSSGASPALAIASTPTVVREAAASRCRPRRSHTIVSTRRVRVYSVRRGRELSHHACLLARGVPLELQGALPRPATDVAGSVVAFVSDWCLPRGCQTTVSVTDLADPRGLDLAFEPARARIRTSEVGSVQVKPNGSVAWIACRAGRHSDNAIDPHCARPGSEARVYKFEAGDRRRLVAKGQRIDPASLRLAGSRLTWRVGTRTVGVTLR